MKINLFSLAGLSIAIVCFLLSLFILIYSKNKLHKLWAFFNISVGIFGLGTFFVGISKTPEQAFLSWKITFLGIPFIAMFFYHVVYEFCQLNNRRMLQFVYIHGIVFSILCLTTNTVFHSMRYVFNQFYYYKAGIGFNVLFPIWIVIVVIAFINLYLYLGKVKGLVLTQGKYLFWGMLLGFSGGATTSFPSWGVDIYPAWDFFICIYATIVSYAILRYRLMDIRLAISNTAIFIGVYALVLGAPFYTYTLGHHFLALLSMLVLATAGPIIFVFLRKQAENKILEIQKRYRIVLDSASKGVKRFRTVEEIVKHISSILHKSIGLKNVAFYLREGAKLFIIKTETNAELYKNEINNKDLIEYFIYKNQPIVIKEMHQERIKNKQNINGVIDESLTEIAVPLVQENRLIGLILLGEKKDGSLFSELDFNTLNQISDRVALAIEHALYLEAEKKRNEEENKDKRQFQLDRFASSMAHQIRNPLNIIYSTQQSFDDLLFQVKDKIDDEFYVSLVRENNEAKACCERITNTIKTILDFGRGRINLRNIKINELLEGFDILNKLIIKKYGVALTVEIQDKLPEFQGDIHLIEEALIIYLDNSCQAVSKENYSKTVAFQVIQVDADYIRCKISDNGHGIAEDTQKVLFDVSTSTKGTEGNGLGLWRVRKICEIMEGSKYDFYSAGRGHGASFWIDLKIANNK